MLLGSEEETEKAKKNKKKTRDRRVSYTSSVNLINKEKSRRKEGYQMLKAANFSALQFAETDRNRGTREVVFYVLIKPPL